MLSDIALARSDHLPADGIVMIMARSHVAVLEAVRTLINCGLGISKAGLRCACGRFHS